MSDSPESMFEAPRCYVGDTVIVDDELVATVFLDGVPHMVSTDSEEVNRLWAVLEDEVDGE